MMSTSGAASTETSSTLSAHAVSQRQSYPSLVFRQFRKNHAAVIGSVILTAIFLIVGIGPFFIEDNRNEINLGSRLALSSIDHPLGTDLLGRDTLTRLIYGGRISLLITTGAVVIGLVVGTTIGIVSGYYGKFVDMVLMRLIDIMMAIPGFLLAIAIIAALGVGTTNVILAVGVFSIPSFARISRGSTLSIENQDYVLAARAIGGNAPRILSRHVLPNIVSPLIVQTTLRLATAMLAASGLSFLGLGPQPPTPEWGAMLSGGRDFITNAPQLVFYPGATIFIVAMCFNLVGDGLRDAIDPYMRR